MEVMIMEHQVLAVLVEVQMVMVMLQVGEALVNLAKQVIQTMVVH